METLGSFGDGPFFRVIGLRKNEVSGSNRLRILFWSFWIGGRSDWIGHRVNLSWSVGEGLTSVRSSPSRTSWSVLGVYRAFLLLTGEGVPVLRQARCVFRHTADLILLLNLFEADSTLIVQGGSHPICERVRDHMPVDIQDVGYGPRPGFFELHHLRSGEFHHHFEGSY